MKTSQNLLVKVPMAASLVLLLVLEILWLKNAYRVENENFKRNTYYFFYNTAISLQDSMIRKNIMHLPPDSNFTSRPDIHNHDSLKYVMSHERNVMDSLRHPSDSKQSRVNSINEDHDTTGQGKPDSVFKRIRPAIESLPPGKIPSNTFLVKLNGDSININRLKNQFDKELTKAGIHLPYMILVKKGNIKGKEIEDGSNATSMVGINPSWVYAVHFENTGIYVLEKIMPQVLFCAILTLLILLSFYSMYRNIRSNQRLMELKNDFISNVTHELKTPVSTVLVAIEALQNFNVMKDPDKALQYLEIASKELNRLNLITDKILSTSVFEHRGVEFKTDSVDLKKMIRQVIDSMQPVIEKRKANVRFEEEGGDYNVNGSTVHLMEVIYNLIDNALKYGQPGVNIDLRIKSDNRYAEFSVKDNGPGISPEYHKKIFEKFTRIPSGDIHNSKGYGLGLHYVKEVVESHHGTIGLVSKPGIGSTFTIRIPKAHE